MNTKLNVSYSNILMFTDLDGTLLDSETYNFKQALPALKILQSHKIPLILVSSKTRAEIIAIQKTLPIDTPFISENGGGIFFPTGFSMPKGCSYIACKGYNAIFIGKPVKEVIEKARHLRKQFNFKGFTEMSVEEIGELTGLDREHAVLASMREFDEPVVLKKSDEYRATFCMEAANLGLDCVQGGKFFHLFSGGDKGRAVKIVLDIYRQSMGDVFSIALGDSPNDLPMLQVVDKAVLMKKSDGSYMEGLSHPDVVKAPGGGPVAWNTVVISLLGAY